MAKAKRVALVGQPNVGKSLLMNRLTGARAVVSNYPGTTVEITTGRLSGNKHVLIQDTPGTYSLKSGSPEQRVTQQLLDTGEFDLIVNVVDATNLARNLCLTLELLELRTPVVVALNQHDRLCALGMSIDSSKLARALGVPVLPVSAFTKRGLEPLVRSICEHTSMPAHPAPVAPSEVPGTPADEAIATRHRRAYARELANFCMTRRRAPGVRQSGILDSAVAITIALAVVLYFAFLGMSIVLSVSEHTLSGALVPVQALLEAILAEILSDAPVASLLSRAIAEGLLVPFGTVMPAMISVYMLMAVLEDSGLLSRFSAALDSLTSLAGLPGQSVIPLALGLGCRSPAILAARVLPGMKERVIVITLLSITVPCAATIGIVGAVVDRFGASARIISLSVAVAFFALLLSAKMLIPGASEPFIVEVPPARMPSAENVVQKTWHRMSSFFSHVLPLLLLMNVAIRLLIDSGLLAMSAPAGGIASEIFGVRAEVLIGVLTTAIQRYLAPVFLLNLDLSPREATIACVMVCLSFPCAPVIALSQKEIGLWRTTFIFLLGAALPLSSALLLNALLP